MLAADCWDAIALPPTTLDGGAAVVAGDDDDVDDDDVDADGTVDVGVESVLVAAVRLAPRTNVENASRSATRWS